jgi:hypothetical protein
VADINARPELFHPAVVASYVERVEAEPKRCHEPYGACMRSAQKPAPHWCVRPLGHPGVHQSEAVYERRKAQILRAVQARRAR